MHEEGFPPWQTITMDCYSSGDDGTFPLKKGKQKETHCPTESFDIIEEPVASSDSDDMKELLSHYPLSSDPNDYQEHDHNAIAEEALIKDVKCCYWEKIGRTVTMWNPGPDSFGLPMFCQRRNMIPASKMVPLATLTDVLESTSSKSTR